jgi:microcystin-dependent protein
MVSTYCPKEYLEADGRTLSPIDYKELYFLLGDKFGVAPPGKFRLPDLRGRSVVGMSETLRRGEARGSDTHTLSLSELPFHIHKINPAKLKLSGTLSADTSGSTDETPVNRFPGVASIGAIEAYTATPPNTYMKEGIVTGNLSGISSETTTTGSAVPFDIASPRIALTACIAISGFFPQRPQ